MRNCTNCAWFCHSDGKCYGNHTIFLGKEIGITLKIREGCDDWAFDGLEDWEREPEESLTTM